VAHTIIDSGAVIDRLMKFGAYQLRIVAKPDARGHLFVIRADKQRQRLREPFQKKLSGGMHRN
jgi:hypothetical protein